MAPVISIAEPAPVLDPATILGEQVHGGEGAVTRVHTSGHNSVGAPEERNNSGCAGNDAAAFEPNQPAAALGEYQAQVLQATAVERERRARRLEIEGRAFASARRRKRAFVGVPERDGGGRPVRDGKAPESINPWHEARARGLREQERRLAACGSGAALQVTCKACSTTVEVPIGCGIGFICRRCKMRDATRFRGEFDRKRFGLITVAASAGLTDKYRRREVGGRLTEKLITCTIPDGAHATPEERVRVASETRDAFFPLLRAYLKARYGHLSSGVTSPETGAELTLFDVMAHVWVIEATQGADRLGHVHLHFWFFGPFIPKAELRVLWAAAYASVVKADVRGGAQRILPIVDIRRAHEVEGSIASELVKYLVKDFDTDSDGTVRRMPADTYARLWKALQGTRRRQSSAGLSAFAKERHCACKACQYAPRPGLLPRWRSCKGEHRLVFVWAREHWGKVAIVHPVEQRARAREKLRGSSRERLRAEDSARAQEPTNVLSSGSREAELRGAHEQKNDAAWLCSSAQRPIAAKMARILGVSNAWTCKNLEERTPYDLERNRFVEHGEPAAQGVPCAPITPCRGEFPF